MCLLGVVMCARILRLKCGECIKIRMLPKGVYIKRRRRMRYVYGLAEWTQIIFSSTKRTGRWGQLHAFSSAPCSPHMLCCGVDTPLNAQGATTRVSSFMLLPGQTYRISTPTTASSNEGGWPTYIFARHHSSRGLVTYLHHLLDSLG